MTIIHARKGVSRISAFFLKKAWFFVFFKSVGDEEQGKESYD